MDCNAGPVHCEAGPRGGVKAEILKLMKRKPGRAQSVPQEWLVADHLGGFAMGSLSSGRTRKYHGFFQRVTGRGTLCGLADLEVQLDGVSVWPHLYSGGDSPEQVMSYPGFSAISVISASPPEWEISLESGKLSFRVESKETGSIDLIWRWKGKKKKGPMITVRPLFGFRNLHGLGGKPWVWRGDQNEARALDGQGDAIKLNSQGFAWRESRDWYRNFVYPEELARGYECREDLYSAGYWEGNLVQDQALVLKLTSPAKQKSRLPAQLPRSPVLDFVLLDPPGIVAGFPWFGEWGRDSFVSLPGICMAWLDAGGAPEQVEGWAIALLKRWGAWIESDGMLPNLVDSDGQPQWDSSDATLWWCHSLAALWQMSLLPSSQAFKSLESSMLPLLESALRSIEQGKHRHLKQTREGFLAVNTPHSTWMDARVDGSPVSPRQGLLPDINALWYQAKLLHALWERRPIEELGEIFGPHAVHQLIEAVEEHERPNRVFLHSLPLAPTFISAAWSGDQTLARIDLTHIQHSFKTPRGLRTLDPDSSEFQPSYAGTQKDRDRAYHQGTAWAWLGAHFEMARLRFLADGSVSGRALQKPDSVLIEGHLEELSDPISPFRPAGAPAQAWSLACYEEARLRNALSLDSVLLEQINNRRTQPGKGIHAQPTSA